MKGFLLSKLIDLALPMVVGVIVPYLVDGLKRGVAWIDKSPAAVKQSLAIVIAGAITGLSSLVGQPLPTDLAQWDGSVVGAVTAGLLAIAIKQNKQLKRVAEAIPPVATPVKPIAEDSPFKLPEG